MKLEFIVYKTEYNSKWGNLDKSEITKILNHDQYINKRLEARYVQAKEKLLRKFKRNYRLRTDVGSRVQVNVSQHRDRNA